MSAAAIVRRHFHWCLAAVVAPVILLPLEWAAALSHRRSRATSEYRRWSRLLFALVVVDTVIAGLVIALVASGGWGVQTLAQGPSPTAEGERVPPERRSAMREPAPNAAEPALSCTAEFQVYANDMLRWVGLWAAVALMIALWLASRRVHGHAPALWSWVAAALGGEEVVAMLALWSVCVSLGRTPEGMLVAQVIRSLALLVVGVVAMRRMERAGLLGAPLEPRLGTGRAVLLGFFYLAVVNRRLNILVSAVEALAHVRVPTPPPDAFVSALGGLSALGQMLLAVRLVMLVPVAEEVLFRGVILPRLTPWMGAAGAVVATSAIFAALHADVVNEAVGVRAAAIFIMALVLGWARLRTGNLTAPITIHMITNAFALWFHP